MRLTLQPVSSVQRTNSTATARLPASRRPQAGQRLRQHIAVPAASGRSGGGSSSSGSSSSKLITSKASSSSSSNIKVSKRGGSQGSSSSSEIESSGSTFIGSGVLGSVAAVFATLVMAAMEVSQASLLASAAESAGAAFQAGAGAFGRAAVGTAQDAVFDAAFTTLTNEEREEALSDAAAAFGSAAASPDAAREAVAKAIASGGGKTAAAAAGNLLVSSVGQAVGGKAGSTALTAAVGSVERFVQTRLSALPLGSGSSASVAKRAAEAAREQVVGAVEGVVGKGIQTAAGLAKLF